MENRITIKFIYGFRPYIAGDIATVSKDEANRMIRFGYAEIYITDQEKEAAALEQIADPEALKTEPETTESAQDGTTTEPVDPETKVEPEIEKQADTAPIEDRAIHGPKTAAKKKVLKK